MTPKSFGAAGPVEGAEGGPVAGRHAGQENRKIGTVEGHRVPGPCGATPARGRAAATRSD